MHKQSIYILLLMFFLSTHSKSEPKSFNKDVLCEDTPTLINSLVNGEYMENPVWSGIDYETKTTYGVLMNSKTGTWTIIQFNEKMACVLGIGEGAKSLMFGSKNVELH